MILKIFIFMVTFPSIACLADGVYVSNVLGMAISEVNEYRIDEYEYTLRITTTESGISRSLLHYGEEVKLWIFDYEDGELLKEQYYEGKTLTEEIEYLDGRVEAELFYGISGLVQKRDYLYEEDELSAVAVYDGEGELLYTDSYERSKSGRLRKLGRAGNSSTEESQYVYSRGRIAQEWHGLDGAGTLTRYSDGNVLAEEEWDSSGLIYAQRKQQNQVTIEDAVAGTSVEQVLDGDGRIIEEITKENGQTLLQTLYTYQEDLLSVRTEITATEKMVTEYVYDNSDEVKTAIHSKNDRTIKVVTYTGENGYFEDIYRNGSPMLRVYFEDGVKVKEEFLSPPAEIN